MNRKIETDKERVGKYYYRVGEEICGPVDAELLKQKHHAGALPEETLFWKERMTGWRFYRSVFDFRAVVGRVVSLLSGVQDSGVEWKGFFSQVWRKHTWTELREVFCAETEPGGLPLPRVNISSPKPWLYTRILLWGIVLSVLAFMSISTWDPVLGVHLFMAVAALVTPLAVLVMAYELNTRRDLSTMAIVRALIGVVIIALPVSGSLNTWASSLLGGTNVQDHAWLAGFVEEPAKLVTAPVLAAMMRIRMNRVLRAVLLGCAVGAAFGYLETWTQYLPEALTKGGVGAMLEVAILRAIVASPGHVIWTGITAGAFAIAQVHWERKHGEVRRSMFLWRNLLSWRFWRIAWIAVACHAIHNMGGFFLDPVLYLFGCGVLWRLVRVGYVQMWETRGLNGDYRVAQFSRETWVEPLLRRLSIHFDGTMNRRRYWTLLLTVSGCLIGLGILTFEILDEKSSLQGFLSFEFIALLIWFLPLLCSMMTRRLHDMGKSGKHTLYLVPLNFFFFLPALILGFSRGAGQEIKEKEDAPQPHSPVDNPEADPVRSMALAALPSGFMPCTECCVPGAEEKWAHCDVCGGSRRIPLVAKSSNEHAVRISLPWFAWHPSFSGRLTRKTYWGMNLIPVAVIFLLGLVQLQGDANATDTAMGFAVLFALLFFFVWGMGVTVRRLHDIGKSGLWLLLIVPLNLILFFLPSIILGLIDSSPGTNEWGANAKAWH